MFARSVSIRLKTNSVAEFTRLIEKDARIKVLGDGVIDTKLEVHAHSVSATARQKIESAGGSIVIIAPGV